MDRVGHPSGQVCFKLCLGQQKLCAVPLSDLAFVSTKLSRDSNPCHRCLPLCPAGKHTRSTLYPLPLYCKAVAFLFLKVPRSFSINSPGHKRDEFLSLVLVAADIPYLFSSKLSYRVGAAFQEGKPVSGRKQSTFSGS